MKPKEKEKAEKKINRIGYMVHVSGKGEPRFIHTNQKAAIAEANRLADRSPNNLVRVLRITHQVMGKVTPEVVPMDFPIYDEEIPF
jgi:hypothetical protein